MAEAKKASTGVNINKTREKPTVYVELTTPHGAQIEVSESRAAAFLARPGIRLGDGSLRKYVPAGEDPVVHDITTGAMAPRTGNKANTPEVE